MSEQPRCAISVRIIGVMHRVESNVKMFMISILWSDNSDVIIYRSFHDFKKLNKQLKKRFVVENSLRKTDRVIPKFRDIKSNFQKKSGPGKAMLRMRLLETYCSQLLDCDYSVTQSSEVIQFFIPKDQDLQPDFAKNSTMILPSEDLREAESLGQGHSKGQRLSMGNVTHPFVTRMYCCVAPYETKDTLNRSFTVALGERLDVLIKDPAGWWLVENESKRLAWFPAPYLELCDEEEEEEEEEEEGGILLGDMLFCAVRTFSAKQNDELSVPIGSVVEVLKKSDDGWWFSRYNGRIGYVPCMYLQPYQNPRAELHFLQRKLHKSSLNLAMQSVAGKSDNRNHPNLHESSLEKPLSAQQTKWLQKAKSLADLSDAWPRPAQIERQESGSESWNSSLDASSSGSEFSFSSRSSSDSEPSSPSSSLTGSVPQIQAGSPSSSPPPPEQSSDGQGGTDISLVLSSRPSRMPLPKVPPRPQDQEIMARCTTMTRKAALASRARLVAQPSLVLTF